MATADTSLYGLLKGEVLLANGSRVLFEAPKWEFSYPAVHNSGYCTIKAEECPNDQQAGIHIDGKQLTQKIREAQNQSIMINVELTEEGKRAVKETILSKIENVHSKPPVSSDDWVKDMHALLLEYVETFPREIELRDRAYPLLNRVYEDLKKAPPPKKANERDPLWEIVKELSESNGTIPGSVYERCIFCNALDDSLSNLKHEDTCIISKAYRLVWHKQHKESLKKQEESTALFDVISKAVLQHSGSLFHAHNHDDTIRARYNVRMNTWDLYIQEIPSVQDYNRGYSGSRSYIEDIARQKKIDLSKGWRMVNVSGVRG